MVISTRNIKEFEGHLGQDPLQDCVAVGGRSFLTSRCLPNRRTPFQTFLQLHLLVDNSQYSNFAQQMSVIATQLEFVTENKTKSPKRGSWLKGFAEDYVLCDK